MAFNIQAIKVLQYNKEDVVFKTKEKNMLRVTAEHYKYCKDGLKETSVYRFVTMENRAIDAVGKYCNVLFHEKY